MIRTLGGWGLCARCSRNPWPLLDHDKWRRQTTGRLVEQLRCTAR